MKRVLHFKKGEDLHDHYGLETLIETVWDALSELPTDDVAKDNFKVTILIDKVRSE